MFLLLLPALPAVAQKGNPMLYKEVQLTHKPYTLHTLTRELQRQSGITFSYNAFTINPDRKIRLKKDRMTVREILSLIKRKTGVGYKLVSGSHIIYTPPGPRGRKRRATTTKTKHPLPQQEGEENGSQEEAVATTTAMARDSAAGLQIVVVGDSTTAAGYYISGGGGGGGAYGGNNNQKYPVTVISDDDEWEDPYSDLDYPSGGGLGISLGQSAAATFVKNNILLAGVLSADETYYFNPGIRAGLDFLYGTIAYHATGPYPQWRYGLGTSASIAPDWRIHLAFNTGQSIRQNYNILSFDTTINQSDSVLVPVITEHNTPLVVQSKLVRFILSAEWNAGGNFHLGAGITFNHLHTQYFSNGLPVTLSDILPIGYDADKKYKTLNPPYILSNTYSGNKFSNTKIWLGFQVTLVYRLDFSGR